MSNDQSDRQEGTFENIPIQFDRPWKAVRGDAEADNLMTTNFGIRFIHYACMPDPLYQVDLGGIRTSFDQEDNQQFSDNDKFHRENGFLYFRKGIIWGIFQNNSKDFRSIPSGLYSDSGATITLNRYYQDSDEKIKITENDKFIPCELPSEFFSVNWQKFDHNPTGYDRLEFKACEVVDLIDSSGVVYNQNVDFTIQDGNIHWTDGANRPGLDSTSGKGKVCSVRYTYKPYFYVKMVMHDIRIRPAVDPDTGQIVSKSGPLLVSIQADWIYLDRRTANDGDTAAQLDAADTPNTGPR